MCTYLMLIFVFIFRKQITQLAPKTLKVEPVYFRKFGKLSGNDEYKNKDISGSIESCARFLIFL